MTTARDLVTDALMACGQYGQGQAPSAADAALGVRVLQRLLDSWSNDGFVVWTTADMTVATVAGDEAYDFTEFDIDGVAPATVNDYRVPVNIQNVWLRDDTIDLPLDEIHEAEYDAIPDKAVQAVPCKYMWKRYVHNYAHDDVPPDEPTPNDLRARIYLYPAPNKAYTLHVKARLTLQHGLGLDDAIVMPPGSERMIVQNLAVELCDFFGIDPKPGLMQSASTAYEQMKTSNYKLVEMINPLAPGRRYRIESGGF